MEHLQKKMSGQRGFTLLLAALIASIVLSLGAAIFSIAQKELALSSIGRDSQKAFYAADSAAECALYWDSRCQYFATTTPQSCNDPSLTLPPTCDGQAFSASGRSDTLPYMMTFRYAPNGFCTDVFVTKAAGTQPGSISTTVRADGYSAQVNTAQSMVQIVAACGVAIQGNANTLQRSVELHY